MLLIGDVLLKNTLVAVETGDCPFTATAGLSTFSSVGLAMLTGTLLPATPEFSSSMCTSAVKAVLESTVEMDCSVKSKFECFKAESDASKEELESSLFPAIGVVVPLLSNTVSSARPIIESTEFDVVTTLPVNDFVVLPKWSITSSKKSESGKPDIPRSKVVELALVKPSSAVSACEEQLLGGERLLGGGVAAVRLAELVHTPAIRAINVQVHTNDTKNL